MDADAQLVARSLAGDVEAFGSMVERHRESIVGFCRRQTGDPEAAQDLAQEVFLSAYFDLHALREPASVGAWLRAIALRRCQSWHRNRRESPWPHEAMTARLDADAGVGALARSTTRLLAEELMGRLPAPQRQAVRLKYRDGYSVAEIADLLAVPPETVRTRLRRARQGTTRSPRRSSA